MKHRTRERGYAYLFALLVAATLTGAVLVTVDNSNLELAMARNRFEAERSQWLARAAVNHAAWRMCYDNAYRTQVTLNQIVGATTAALPIAGPYAYGIVSGGSREWIVSGWGKAAGTGAPMRHRIPDSTLALSAEFPVLRDAYINEGAATTNYGGMQVLSVRPTPGNCRRILLDFNVSTLPLDCTILSAYVDLWISSATGDETLELVANRLEVDFTEGTRAGGGLADGVNWNNRKLLIAVWTPWDNPGGEGDYSTSGSSIAALLPVRKGLVRIDATRILRDWVRDRLPQYGIIIRAEDESESNPTADERLFYSRESADPTVRPRLVVRYRPSALLPI